MSDDDTFWKYKVGLVPWISPEILTRTGAMTTFTEERSGAFYREKRPWIVVAADDQYTYLLPCFLEGPGTHRLLQEHKYGPTAAWFSSESYCDTLDVWRINSDKYWIGWKSGPKPYSWAEDRYNPGHIPELPKSMVWLRPRNY